MESLPPTDVSSLLQSIVGDHFMMISIVTFYACEAIFAAMPIERARMKQLTALCVGGGLGLLLLDGMIADRLLQGVVAGGAATIAVAKFKGKSVPVPQPPVDPDPASVSVVAPLPSQPHTLQPLRPVEHL